MPALVNQAKSSAATVSPREFFLEWMMSTAPFAFRSANESYANFKSELSTLLEVHSADLLLVGSGQLGFSLNPTQLLRDFRPGSDLDVAVISPILFEAAWLNLLEIRDQVRMLDAGERHRFKKTRENFFDGYLRPDMLPTECALKTAWFPRLAGPFRTPLATKHQVTAWLFRSWWHVEAFYCDAITRVQPQIRKLLEQE
ncbi:MAG: hypothetical protein IPK74_10090 [Deltaproteobacteria bacterium]|nr:hypothetical protein [Deltaproteobacteria bacterium]